MPPTYDIPDWSYAYGGPSGQGKIRSTPEDFVVNEILGFSHSGEGEHASLLIEKRGENTDYVARVLARFAGVASRDVSYAGLKDRHAVTRQWFSVYLPGKPDPDWQACATDTIKIIQAVRHSKKLKRGALAGNEFKLLIRDWQGDADDTLKKLVAIKALGAPNYFGPQRFGKEGQNVNKALAMFLGNRVKRQQRSLYLSAARAYLFNHILALRVQQQSWNKAISGDAFNLEGSRSYFQSAELDEEIRQRVNAAVIHPTGALWGIGESAVTDAAQAIEMDVIAKYQELTEGLIQAKVAIGRRALRVNLSDLEWEFLDATGLSLKFTLPAGSYATAVVRELI